MQICTYIFRVFVSVFVCLFVVVLAMSKVTDGKHRVAKTLGKVSIAMSILGMITGVIVFIVIFVQISKGMVSFENTISKLIVEFRKGYKTEFKSGLKEH